MLVEIAQLFLKAVRIHRTLAPFLGIAVHCLRKKVGVFRNYSANAEKWPDQIGLVAECLINRIDTQKASINNRPKGANIT